MSGHRLHVCGAHALALCAFAVLFCLVSLQACMAQTAMAQRLIPPPLPAGVEVVNPKSGLYSLLVQLPRDLSLRVPNPKYVDAAPLPAPPPDEYGRLSWHSLEPSEGKFDFSVIDAVLQPCPSNTGLSPCLPRGGRFSFRIMALNPQVQLDTNVSKGEDSYPVYSDLPSYFTMPDALGRYRHGWLLPVDPRDVTQGHYFVPDWNDAFFQQRIRAVLEALGRRYDGDPRIGWLDIGLYGNWGEWHTAGLLDATDYTHGIPYDDKAPYFGLNKQAYAFNTGRSGQYERGTIASKTAIVDAYARAFPNTQLVMLTDDGDALCHALRVSTTARPIGLRRDSLGSGSESWTYQFPDKLTGCATPADEKLIVSRWELAPFIAEAFGNGSSPTFPCRSFETDPSTGLYNMDEQVLRFHLAAIKNASICTGPWDALTLQQKRGFRWAGFHAGYRFAPVEVEIERSGLSREASPHLSIATRWQNTGVTPAYDAWRVEFSLWTSRDAASGPRERARLISRADLRKILPTGRTSVTVTDDFAIPSDRAWPQYELRVRVVDPHGYLAPMQLALQHRTADGYYPLGRVTLAQERP